MRTPTFFSALGIRALLLLAVVGSSPLEARKWLTVDGQEYEADLVRFKNGIVILKVAGGGNTMLGIEKLSPDDQEFVREKFPQGDQKEEVRVTRTVKKAATRKVPMVTETGPNPTPLPNQRSSGVQPHLKDLDPGDPAPQLIGRKPNSPDKVAIADLKGSLVLVEFFSIHNPATQREMPAVAAAYRKYGGKGLEIIGVTLDDDYRSVYKFKKAYGVTWATTTDKYRRLIKRWGVTVLPTRVLIDRNGFILQEHVYARNLDATIQKHLKRR